jgi:hypothetical protein
LGTGSCCRFDGGGERGRITSLGGAKSLVLSVAALARSSTLEPGPEAEFAGGRSGGASPRAGLVGSGLVSLSGVGLLGPEGKTLVSLLPSSGFGVEVPLLLSGRIRLTTSGRGIL